MQGFPPPPWLIGAIGGLSVVIVMNVIQRLRGQFGKKIPIWIIGVSVGLSVAPARILTKSVWHWTITPIVVQLDDGQVGFGHWRVDRDGVGHSSVTIGDVTCAQTYDGRNAQRYVEKTFSCGTQITGTLRVLRDGRRDWLTRGTGVVRVTDQDGQDHFGWYIFGPRARLAALTYGHFGLPDAVADSAAYQQVETAGRKVDGDKAGQASVARSASSG